MKNKEILDSWKEISSYLDRDIRTCYRWEKQLGLPIHRIDNNSSRSKVFAFKSEIDQWLKEKANSKEFKKKSFIDNKWGIIGLVSGLILLSAVLAFLYFFRMKIFTPPSKNLSIAVLPFENIDSQKYNEYFCEGLTNVIINNLSSLDRLKVISVTSVFKYKNTQKSAKQIGEELCVSHVLRGNIKRTDDKIKLDAKLIRTKDGKYMWNEKIEEELINIFSIQDTICSKISETLNIDITQKIPNQSSNGKTHDYLAFDNYLKGNYILNRLNGDNHDPWELYHQGKLFSGKCTPESNEVAIDLFKQAIEINSNFTQAYIGLAQCYTNYVNFAWDYNKKWLDKAEDLVKTVEKISTDFPEYYSTLIEIYLLKEVCFNENTKRITLELAHEGIKKYPNHPQLNSIVGYCYYLKFGEEGDDTNFVKALDYKEKSFRLNPYTLNNIAYTELLMLNKEFIKAIKICNIIKKFDSSSMVKFRQGEIYYYMGDLEQSKAIFQQFEIPLEYKIGSLLYLGMIASQKGEMEEVKKIVDEFKIISPMEYKFSWSHLKLSSTYLGLGIKEIGYKHLDSFFKREITKKLQFIYHKYLEIDKNFDNFKEEDKFKKIIRNKET